MSQAPSFGRRGRLQSSAAPASGASTASLDVSLTPEQRAYLFGGDAQPQKRSTASAAQPVPHVRSAGIVACLVVTAIVAALTLVGKPHETVAALPPGMEEQAKAIFHSAGDWFTPLTLAWSIFVIASNLGANLWLTRKICGWLSLHAMPGFVATGAGMSFVVAYLTAFIGMGESEIGYVIEALSGGGVALLYRLLAGRAVPKG